MPQIIELTLQMPDGRKEVPIHPIVLQDDEHLILVDCGFIGSLKLLEIELGKHGISIEQLTALVLTHHDHDHMGAAAALKRANPKIQIYSSLEESVYISAREKPLRLVQAEELQAQLPPQQQAFGRMFCDMLQRVEPVTVDAHLTDSQETGWCGGCQVLLSAGHTPGHLTVLQGPRCSNSRGCFCFGTRYSCLGESSVYAGCRNGKAFNGKASLFEGPDLLLLPWGHLSAMIVFSPVCLQKLLQALAVKQLQR